MNNTIINEIISYCPYCKDALYITDKIKVEKGKLYHKECCETKNMYFDPFELEIEND